MERVVSAFTEEQAARLAKISVRQLRYWDKTGFFEPSYAEIERRLPYSRIYSFDDVVGLRVLGLLRNSHGVPLQHLRRVRDRLKLDQAVWANSIIFVLKNNVYFENEIGSMTNGETGEDTLPNIPIPMVISNVRDDAAQMKLRHSEALGTVSRHKSIARNAVVFADTRIPIDIVKEYLAAGFGVSDILAEYPSLTQADIEAAINYFGLKAA